MERKLSRAARTLQPSPIQELSHLAQRCGAINLAGGFPDFPAPTEIKDAAVAAINADHNQYRHVQGVCDLLAANMKQRHGFDINPLTDLVICCGQSEAFAAAIFARKLFCLEELEAIARACCKMDCIAITDEVYEYIVFDMKKHISLASLPGMQERTIITSSLSKTFSITGWRIGWACAPANIASAIRNIHIKIVDSAPAPFQEAALYALRSPPSYFMSLKTSYEAKRDYVVDMLSRLGFQIWIKPQGSVFVLAELPKNTQLSDIEFVSELIKKAGVAAVPGCGFFHADSSSQSYCNRYVRFAFCKSDATLSAAARKMGELLDSEGHLQL